MKISIRVIQHLLLAERFRFFRGITHAGKAMPVAENRIPDPRD